MSEILEPVDGGDVGLQLADGHLVVDGAGVDSGNFRNGDLQNQFKFCDNLVQGIFNLLGFILVKNRAILGLFFFVSVFLDIVNETKIADDWILTLDIWHRKQPLEQLRHNHCPIGCMLYPLFRYFVRREVSLYSWPPVWAVWI